MLIDTPTRLAADITDCRARAAAGVASMADSFGRNRMLSNLPSDERQRLFSGLELIHFAQGDLLYAGGEQVFTLHFPISCVVTLTCTTENGATGEMGIIGNEGVTGASQILGGNMPTCCSAEVQVGGTALRMKSSAFLEAFQQGGTFQQLMLEYIQLFIDQVSQNAVCNSLHPLGQRLTRRLLMTWDRIPSDAFAMTQDRMALILGVRRASITQIACHLQREGLIRYGRGHVRLVNRPGLEAAACECYRIVKRQW